MELHTSHLVAPNPNPWFVFRNALTVYLLAVSLIVTAIMIMIVFLSFHLVFVLSCFNSSDLAYMTTQ